MSNSHSSVNEVLKSVSLLVDQHVSSFKNKVQHELTGHGISGEILNEIPVHNFLDKIDSRKKRDSLYEREYFYVPPKAVKLGEKFKNGFF